MREPVFVSLTGNYAWSSSLKMISIFIVHVFYSKSQNGVFSSTSSYYKFIYFINSIIRTAEESEYIGY